ncbi:MAG: N-acetylmuramoyl-L-alanine amidase [Oscillospiraceae bacterium]|nr:N-acetylmuramoyl-L-alanine amidase [Oscillospiraceae bacterium]MDD7277910.1 N-acetylmuramoyl-L-alanine amidase [Oscillospiraceae bacterium]MDY6209294.1 N-acetylmuramoyl-L-alanine amidase [Oscillospiraceae bacterium]
MKITEMLLTPNKYSRPCIKLEQVRKIAVHYVGNPKSTAKNNRDYFENLKDTHERYVSAHFIIGLEGEIIQCIPLNEWSYCTNQANGYSISIECCHPDSTGKFNGATEDSLVELCAFLCQKFGLSADDIIRHYDVTGKRCPLWYVDHPNDFKAFRERVRAAVSGSAVNDGQKMYYVQVGAFGSKENAEAYLAKVKKDYPGAFIKVI